MNSSIIRKNISWGKVIIISTLSYFHQAYAITPQDLSPGDYQWYKEKITNTHKALDDQAKEDIEQGIGNKERLLKSTDKKTKAPQKEKKKSNSNDGCISVNAIKFEGGDILTVEVKESIEAEYSNKCLTSSDIESAMSTLVNWLISEGYSTTRVYLEAQDLTSGILRMRIQKGIVADIILEDDDEGSLYLPTLFPFIKGELLDLVRIEQGISQANKQRSNKATMEIVPGEKAGDSIVIVRNETSRPVHFNASLDNHGSETTGQIQAAVTITGDNFIGLNDILTFTHRQSVQDLRVNLPGKSMSDSIALMIPVGFFTHTLSYSRSTYESKLNAPSGAELISTGSTDSISGTIDRVMFRNTDTITNSYVKLNYSRGINYLNDLRLDVSSKDIANMTFGSSVSSKIFDNPWSLSINYSIGVPLFGAEGNPDNSHESHPVPLFKKIVMDMSYTQPLSWLSDNLTLTSSISAQYALTNLPSSQRMSIGSKFSVRGYNDNSLSEMTGVILRMRYRCVI